MSARDWPRLRRLFRLPMTAARVRADVDKELHFHIEGRIEELLALGLTRAEAEREARRRFGDYRRIGSEVERLDLATHRRRDVQDRLEALRADFAYTVRVLAKQPVFTGVVVVTLTLAIAATTSIFHVVDRVVLNPLPYSDPDRIVYLGWQWAGKGGVADALSPRSFQFWHDNARVFDGLATARSFEAVLGDGEQSNSVRGARLTSDYLTVVHAMPMIGRAFAPEEYVDPAPPVVMLTHAFWTSRFGADRSVVGRTIRLDGRPFTVIGVMPKRLDILEASDGIQVVTPFAFARAQLDDNGNNYTVVGRLKPNVTTPQIKADMESVFERYRAAYPNGDKDDRGVRVLRYGDIFTSSISSPLLLLLGATSFVLLLAFANVANLLFARTLSRQREFALRTALGASRVRVARQVVLEMLVLGSVSAVLATVAGLAGVRATVGLTNGWLLREAQLRIDPRTVVFTAAVTLAASLAVGLLVALSATRVDLGRSLAEGGRATPIGRRQRVLRDALVSTEAAIAMVLLAGAGLLIASFARLSAVEPGFQREGVFTAKLTHALRSYDSAAAIREFERRALERLRATPGILSAGSTSTLPLTRGWNLPMTVEGRTDATLGGMEWRSASGDYFRAIGIRPITGRLILDSDDAGAPPVVVISESFAKKYWPGESPIGHRLLLGRFRGKLVGPNFDEPAREIVGVVPDLRDMALDQKSFRPTAWVPRPQMVTAFASLPAFAVRATDAGVAATALRRAVLDVDSRLGVPTVASMDDVVSASLWWRRFGVVLMSVFAVVALVLTCVGIYGVVSYSVAQRVHEIGIRIALGAPPSRVTRLVVVQGMRPAILGLIVGLGGALGLTRLLGTMLYKVSPREPLPLGLVALLLVAIALIASYIPARRAARVDPLTALRGE